MISGKPAPGRCEHRPMPFPTQYSGTTNVLFIHLLVNLKNSLRQITTATELANVSARGRLHPRFSRVCLATTFLPAYHRQSPPHHQTATNTTTTTAKIHRHPPRTTPYARPFSTLMPKPSTYIPRPCKNPVHHKSRMLISPPLPYINLSGIVREECCG